MNDTSDTKAEDLESVFGRIADEFTDRLNRGERPDVEEYACRYPEIAEVLREGLLVLPAMRQPAAAYAGADVLAPSRQVLPERLGEYRILRAVGHGGMGAVYEAVQEPLGRRVALKVLPFHGLMDVLHSQRFRREARAAARLHHTNIVPVFGIGEQDGVHYYAMQFIEGESLQTVGARATDCKSVARWGWQIAEALAYAHGHGVLHRDVKPSNLLLDRAGNVWLTDFGLARADGLPDLTRTGDVVGTLRYMAPEQLDGTADGRSDVYSLGLVLYELLTRRPAFSAADRNQLVKQVTQEEPPAPRRLDGRIPSDLDTIVVKAIAKEPERRYSSAAALAEDLRRFLSDQPIAARRASGWEQAWRWCCRRPAAAGLLGVSVAAAISLLTFALVHNVQLGAALKAVGAERDRAEANALQAGRAHQQAVANLKKAHEAVDRLLTRVGYTELSSTPRMERTRRALLEDALQFYAGFLEEESDDPEVRAETAKAYRRAADIRQMLGARDLSEQAYRQAIRLTEQLATAAPAVPAHRLELALAHKNLGLLLRGKGRLREAEAAYHTAMELLEGLTAEDTTATEPREQLAKCYNHLGNLLWPTERRREAEAAHTRSYEILRQLVADFPDRPEFRYQLAVSHIGLGRFFWSTKRSKEAEEAYGRAITLLEKLVADHPTAMNYRAALASGHNHQGILLQTTARPEEAATAYRRALAILERLAADTPSAPGSQHDLAGTLNNLAKLLTARGNPAEGRRLLERAIVHERAALLPYPKDPFYRADLRTQYGNLATALLRLGRHAAAATAAADLAGIQPVFDADGRAAATIMARCTRQIQQATKLPEDQRAQLSNAYADQAVAFLRQAVHQGYRDGASLRKDNGLDPLRQREDFQQLLAELNAQAVPKSK